MCPAQHATHSARNQPVMAPRRSPGTALQVALQVAVLAQTLRPCSHAPGRACCCQAATCTRARKRIRKSVSIFMTCDCTCYSKLDGLSNNESKSCAVTAVPKTDAARSTNCKLCSVACGPGDTLYHQVSHLSNRCCAQACWSSAGPWALGFTSRQSRP